MRTAVVLGLVAALVVAGFLVGLLFSAGCSEQDPSERMCDYAFVDSPVWWWVVLGPAAFCAATWLVPRLRRYAVRIALITALIAITLWVVLLDAVGN